MNIVQKGLCAVAFLAAALPAQAEAIRYGGQLKFVTGVCIGEVQKIERTKKGPVLQSHFQAAPLLGTFPAIEIQTPGDTQARIYTICSSEKDIRSFAASQTAMVKRDRGDILKHWQNEQRKRALADYAALPKDHQTPALRRDMLQAADLSALKIAVIITDYYTSVSNAMVAGADALKAQKDPTAHPDKTEKLSLAP